LLIVIQNTNVYIINITYKYNNFQNLPTTARPGTRGGMGAGGGDYENYPRDF